MRSRFLIQTCVCARTRVSRVSTLASVPQQGGGLQGAQGEAHITLEDALAPGALHAAFILPSLPNGQAESNPALRCGAGAVVMSLCARACCKSLSKHGSSKFSKDLLHIYPLPLWLQGAA